MELTDKEITDEPMSQIELVARAICDHEDAIPNADAAVMRDMNNMKSWEARIPVATAVLEALNSLTECDGMDLTVSKLIKELQKCDGDSVVMVHGSMGGGTFLANADHVDEILVTRPEHAKWSGNQVHRECDPKTDPDVENVVVIK